MGSLHSGFFLTRVTGDPIEWLTLAGASDSAKEILRTNLGLDMPLWQQYIKSFVGLFTGDTGMSYYYARSVSDLFAERMIPTISGKHCIGTYHCDRNPLGSSGSGEAQYSVRPDHHEQCGGRQYSA